MKSQILRGQTWHCRHLPRRHSFTYRMFWLCLDLDELASLDGKVAWFGHNRRSLVSIYDADYAGSGGGTIREKLVARLKSGGVTEQVCQVTLVTLPRVAGYVFNPVSFYLCYRADETIAAIVAEVRNTFGERHNYVMTPENADAGRGESVRFRAAKAFYVSPFLDVNGTYEILLAQQADRLSLQITLEQHGCRVFSAGLNGARSALSSKRLASGLCRMPLLAATVMLRIHWHALQLYLRRRLPVYPRTASPDPTTAAASRPKFWHWIREQLVRRASQTHQSDSTLSTFSRDKS